jgi:DNA-binding beta-propeller fold protein YncE
MKRAFLALLIAAAILSSQATRREQVGPLPDGGFLLNSGWRVKPAGKQIPLSTMPMSAVISPDEKFMVVLNGGYNPPSLSVVDLASGREVKQTPVPDAWLGLALAKNGRRLWVGGGSKASVFEFSVSEQGELQPARTIEIVPPEKRSHTDFIGDVALSPDGAVLYAADLYHDSIVVIGLQSGRVIGRFKTGRRPYRILFHPDGKSLFVTSWADGALYHHQADNGEQLAMVRIGAHPTDMVWRDRVNDDEDPDDTSWKARLFVAAANTNNVYTLTVSASKELKVAESINVAMTAQHPLGMTPTALALSPDKNRLYVVCSDANAVALADVTGGPSQVLGFIPVGWYPMAVKTLTDGRLIVLNGRGSGSHPNPKGPNPTVRPETLHGGSSSVEYVGRIQTGSASVIAPFTDEVLDDYTSQSLRNSPYNDEMVDDASITMPAGIEHVLYIVKENRSYDQVLGDIGKGESDPSLVLFSEKVTPNEHKLAREFVLLDNFYVSGDVSADGHNWSTAAIASDYVQKMWPNSYAQRRDHYDYEGGEPAATPPAGYIWTNAGARGITMRNYGYFVDNKKQPAASGPQIDGVRDPTLRPVTNFDYRGFDLDYPDVKRADVFLKDLAQFEATGQMPQLMIMRLGNDHTSGTTPGKIAPLSAAADNDFALGRIVEGVSRSKFWPGTAIFVVEDDAQNGPDHIDSHRSPALAISPYTHHGLIDGTMYNTTSVLRTIELILHMRPMTHFDAGAKPMINAFPSDAPVATTYTVEKPRIPLDQRNPAVSATAARSKAMDFSEADLNDDDELNDVLWLAIRGTSPPAPVRSFFAR